MPNETRSTIQVEWNAADSLLKQYVNEIGAYHYALGLDDYRQAISLLYSMIQKFTGFTSISATEKQEYWIKELEKIESLEAFDDENFQRVVMHKRMKLKRDMGLTIELMQRELNNQRFFYPTTQLLNKEDEEEVADNYERYAYNGIDPSKDKRLEFIRDYWGFALFSENFKAIIERQMWLNFNRDKDALWIIGGYPGSGKSNLAHEIHDFITGGVPDVNRISWEPQSFSDKLSPIMAAPDFRHRIVHYDEANLDKRSSTSRWNKDLTDLYLNIRGKNTMHLWCNPSINMIDGRIRHERLTALIWVYDSTNPNKRFFSVLPSRKVLDFEAEHKELNRELLEKHGRQFSVCDGWFKKYDNKEFLEAYASIKNQRMDSKVDYLISRHGSQQEGNKAVTAAETTKELRMSLPAVYSYVEQMIQRGIATREEMFQHARGKFSLEALAKIKAFKEEENARVQPYTKPGPVRPNGMPQQLPSSLDPPRDDKTVISDPVPPGKSDMLSGDPNVGGKAKSDP